MDCSKEQSIFYFMKLTLEIVLLSNNCIFLNCLTAVTNAGFVTVAGAVTSAVALAIFAVILAVTLVAIAIAVTATGKTVQQLAGPGNDALTIDGNHIDNAGNGGQRQNDLGNYF
jgi:hypothetical protein